MPIPKRKMSVSTKTPVLPPETSSSGTPVKQNLLEKLHEFLESKPENYDVTFCVGPEKKVVKGLKVILKAASPIFQKEFEEKWEKEGAIKEGDEGILLQDFDPTAFQQFVKLTMLDTWTADALKKLNLAPDQMFSLMSICRYFEMKNAIKNLEESAKAFFKSFTQYKDSADFLKLSQANLETVLSSDQVGLKELDIFQCACRWAESQCKEQNKEITTDNIRLVLGNCLFQIRFPLMTAVEFTKAIGIQNMLTAEETLEIYKFIGLEEKEKLTFDSKSLPFSTKRRVITVQLKKAPISLKQAVKMTPPFQVKQLGDQQIPTKLPVMKLPVMKLPSVPGSNVAVPRERESIRDSIRNYHSSSGAPESHVAIPRERQSIRESIRNYHSPSVSMSPIPNNESVATLPANCLTLSLLKDPAALTDENPFICDGSEHSINLASRKKIAVHGIGFLGPIEEDSFFDVVVEFKTYVDGQEIYSSKKTKNQIFAQKGKIFQFYFNEPITLTQSQFKEWGNDHAIYYYLKGPDTQSVQRKIGHNSFLQGGGVEFRIGWYSHQLAEIYFKKY